MKLFFQAVQAVTIELLGVVLVVWLLFSFASWGMRSAADNSPWIKNVNGRTRTWRKDLVEAWPVIAPMANALSIEDGLHGRWHRLALGHRLEFSDAILDSPQDLQIAGVR